MKQPCEQLGLNGNLNRHLCNAIKVAAEEYNAILFLYVADCHKYGKIIQDMENAILKKRSISKEFKLPVSTVDLVAK